MSFPLQVGDILAERYELLDKLGAGAFGAVYRARQLGIDRMVAVKILMAEASNIDDTATARFEREAKLSSSLEHPNTITIHDYGKTDDGVLYIIMEYVRGVSLQRMLRKQVRLTPIRAVKITRQILSSVQEAHARGIVHRDMKPGNIMLFDRVGEQDVVKVLDFGIAKFISNDGEGMDAETAREDLTVAGRIVGTPRYMAPEQINGKGVLPASDLYALGLMMYEMIAGKQAITGDSTLSLIAAQISNEAPIDPNDPFVPEVIRPILAKATSKDLATRYQNAGDFLADIDELDLRAIAKLEPLEGRPGWKQPPPPAPAVTGEYQSVHGTSSQPVPADLVPPPSPGLPKGLIFGGIAALLLLAGASAFFLLSGDDPPKTELAANTAQASNTEQPTDKQEDPAAATVKDDDTTPDNTAKGDSAAAKAEDPKAEDPKTEDPKAETPAKEDPTADTTPTEDPTKDTPPPAKIKTVTLSSLPSGANVFLDGKSVGTTPLTIPFEGDETHKYTVALRGHKAEILSLSKESPDSVEVKLSTQKAPNAKVKKKPPVKKAGPKKGSGTKSGGGGNPYGAF